MSWRINIVFFIALLLSCKERTGKHIASQASNSYHSTQHLIEAVELQKVLGTENIAIIDFRESREYEKGHIPNAHNLWRSDIEDKSKPYKGIMANQTAMEKILSGLGIWENDIIIIYDDKGLCDASRLWWVLKAYNFENIKLLNGGWSAWKEGNGAVVTEKPLTIPSKFKFKPKTTFDMNIDKEQLRAILMDEGLVLIDARTADEYSGKRQKSGATRAGRIVGSINKDWMNAVEMSSSRKFKSKEELVKIYHQTPTSKDNLVVTYCHTGVRSAHTTFVLTELLGYTNVKNYDGSWSEWSHYEELPIEKDSITSIY